MVNFQKLAQYSLREGSQFTTVAVLKFNLMAEFNVTFSYYFCVHAEAHAHTSFIPTTTKPLPDLATNTDYDTLTMTAFRNHYSYLQLALTLCTTTEADCDICHAGPRAPV